ncbi:hypothetical protein ACIRPX_11565 [Streptomyces sp. NPDC101225]|uniref:hypothetical protein n=1 Tax=Streptomyces sp. NPDC101225 TaxID=3366135 RepID=UPI003814EF97
MAVDPTDPETFEADGAQEPREIDVEAPEDDAAEQSADLAADHDDPLEDVDPATANEADLVEQRRVVSIDEDDYR